MEGLSVCQVQLGCADWELGIQFAVIEVILMHAWLGFMDWIYWRSSVICRKAGKE